VPCRWQTPTPLYRPDGGVIDFAQGGLVNVKLTLNGQVTTIGHVASSAACVGDGWYFNEPPPDAAATGSGTLTLCPTTCTKSKSATRAELWLGCPTVEAP
jgi:hypothetical protein